MNFSGIFFYLIIKPLSLLPTQILYGISDFLCFVMFRIAGYRKKVVLDNLRRSFPEKDEAWINKTAHKFYAHLCDLIVESVRLFSISERELLRRFVVENPEVLDTSFEKSQTIILVGGHYNNWEMLATAIDQQIKHKSVGIYKPLNNPFFDKIFRESRSRFGMRMLPTKQVARFFKEESSSPFAVIFGADQSPTYSKNVYWLNFLNQETAVASGTESFGVEYNYPVYFGAINKVKRGHYTFRMSLISENPSSEPEGYITQEHVRLLENQILDKPEFWLWTHRRWKRKRKKEEKLFTFTGVDSSGQSTSS